VNVICPTLLTQPVGACGGVHTAVCQPSANVVCPTLLTQPVGACGGVHTAVCGAAQPQAPQAQMVFSPITFCNCSPPHCPPAPVETHLPGCQVHPSVNVFCGAAQAQAPQAQAPQAQAAFSPITICNCTHAGCQPTPHCTPATVCTRPPACPVHPSVNVICPTPSAVHQCGGGNTAATVCTQPAACHPSANVVCPTPSAVQQCGVFTPFCPQ
jgi:hypothetical protein